jgi:hypothetical protein
MTGFSVWSSVFAVIGVLLFSSSNVFPELFEPLMALGFGFLILGSLFCFAGLFKREIGIAKFLPVIVFFLLSFIIVWNEHFQIVRLLTWLKN